MHRRVISHTEVATALSCEAKWDFKYGGHLLGGEVLKRVSVSPRLSAGRAFGAAMAAWHAAPCDTDVDGAARSALCASLATNALELQECGHEIAPQDLYEEEERLLAILGHHCLTVERLPNLTSLEGEFEGPVPSRSGVRGSNRYHFQAFIDGYTDVAEGHSTLAPGQWIVEFKLRDSLHPAWLIATLRQYRWYAWLLARSQGFEPVGILICERVNDFPHPVKINKPTKAQPLGPVSADVRQRTSRVLLDRALAERGIVDREAWQGLYGAVDAFAWQQVVPIQFTRTELAEAGRELTSSAVLISDLDNARRYPVRNASRTTCSMCDFKTICPSPASSRFEIDANFERKMPKRLRGPVEAAEPSPFVTAASAAHSEELQI